ncbi:hypothetical protein [Actibacterium sp. 188UL27-1]|uniref:hypothetical protein n=1 Tax=Actibacterium sp. 188UL27-1 TaxID=2786961 RepID=UPI00195DF578|nr:hypothetical protein [Actibacterium sp. 188UL27-1]MBM7068677.1 hypothetical protein [Actibacterium sp. 188UL27-1]
MDLAKHHKAACQFFEDESGAVTVDWVMLTAVAIALTIAVMSVVTDGIVLFSDKLGAALSALEVATY